MSEQENKNTTTTQEQENKNTTTTQEQENKLEIKIEQQDRKETETNQEVGTNEEKDEEEADEEDEGYEEEDDDEEDEEEYNIMEFPGLQIVRINLQRAQPNRPVNTVLNQVFEQEEDKTFGIPCPEPGSVKALEAVPILLRCVVCHSNQINTVNFPCMHASFCVDCTSQSVLHSNKCPICRTHIMHVSMLYLCHTDTELNLSKKRQRIE